eukprot:TRINITY_DN73155_c0_g1_i1.p1 TRINITY_DN73155_c0_g1~~TRINITY_DN73155_c0_g1_i1.p1  ORF type:complete len:667 (-),score=122.74 TRINITY_DN73155_c0_g1_i1:97-2097(-)
MMDQGLQRFSGTHRFSGSRVSEGNEEEFETEDGGPASNEIFEPWTVGWIRQQTRHIMESNITIRILAVVVSINVVIIVYETNAKRMGGVPRWVTVINDLFLVVYGVDVSLRLFAYKCRFFYSVLNVIDSMVVLSDLAVRVAESYGVSSENLPSLGLMKTFRMLRLVRVLNTLLIFHELYLMMRGMASAFRAIVFAVLLMFLCLTFLAIPAVEIVQPILDELAEEGVFEGCERCPRAYSTVHDAVLTFFQQIMAGDSWGLLSLPLMERSPPCTIILFIAFIVLNLLLMNVVAAVMVDKQTQARESDEEFQKSLKEDELKRSHKRLNQLFQNMDKDGGGALTFEEMLASYRAEPEFRQILSLMDIDEDELYTCFELMDSANESGDVDYAEFTENLHRIRHMSQQTLSVFTRHETRQIRKEIRRIGETLEQVLHLVAPAGTKNGRLTAGIREGALRSSQSPAADPATEAPTQAPTAAADPVKSAAASHASATATANSVPVASAACAGVNVGFSCGGCAGRCGNGSPWLQMPMPQYGPPVWDASSFAETSAELRADVIAKVALAELQHIIEDVLRPRIADASFCFTKLSKALDNLTCKPSITSVDALPDCPLPSPKALSSAGAASVLKYSSESRVQAKTMKPESPGPPKPEVPGPRSARGERKDSPAAKR